MTPAATSRASRARRPQSAARTPSHAARASKNRAIASYVANAPRNWVPARVANSPAASSAARCPYNRRGGPQQAGDCQHEAERQEARRGKAADAVRQGGDGRVEDGAPEK